MERIETIARVQNAETQDKKDVRDGAENRSAQLFELVEEQQLS